MRRCFFCEEPLERFEPGAVPAGARLAYDPRLGRLWQVCPSCSRWNAVPLEERWETLDACERMVRDDGRVLLEGEHLSLVAVETGRLVRVGDAPRVEFSDWRYSERLDGHLFEPPSFLTRLLSSLPERSAGGADYHGVPRLPPVEWLTTSFQEHAGLLTELFLRVPLAETCPSCGDPLALEPADFGRLRMVWDATGPSVVATCAFCDETSSVELERVRPALRVGLAIVNRKHRDTSLVSGAAAIVDRAGGRDAYVRDLSRIDLVLDAADPAERIGLAISLDEAAEAEALETRWREAEELAAIMDGELTEVPGFEAFRHRVLEGEEDGPSPDRFE